MTNLTIYSNGKLYKSKDNGVLKSKINMNLLNAIHKIDGSFKNLKSEDIFIFAT